MPIDRHSFSIPDECRVHHLRWDARVDFTSKTISATADWEIRQSPEATKLVLDTKGLIVESVCLEDGSPAIYQVAEGDDLLGRPLTIQLTTGTRHVTITYHTTPGAEALQWLQPHQTAGKENPFLFTQSQAILARSWIPCQDSPGVRFTYEANVVVPPELMALMSASNPQTRNNTGHYHFEMTHPIPAYLLALAVGDLVFHPVSDRSGIYAEPPVIDSASWEFQDIEKMIAAAETLYGKYPWERYDVIVLPPSFPFGGMENPRLTFVTPTILAGDRSLTSLVAHELAHSWSGNLVTNATWNDFWLNEGFTVYFEHRIMEHLFGRDYAEMLAVLAYQDLKDTVEDLERDNKSMDTRLKLNLAGRSPDEGVTDIAYNKGYFFLRSLEETYGKEKFDRFVRDYFAAHAFHAVDTETFILYLRKYYKEEFNLELDGIERWIYDEGLPADCPKPISEKLVAVEEFLRQWTAGNTPKEHAVLHWTTHEWVHFLKNLPDPLTPEQMRALDALGNFTRSGNAEIVTLWLVKAIRFNYTAVDLKLKEFLFHTGRRKFLTPIYIELLKTKAGKIRAREIYQKARDNYHFVATNTLDALLKDDLSRQLQSAT